MKFDGHEAIAEAALSAALRELPGSALARPELRYFAKRTMTAGYHIRGIRALYIGLPAAPSWIRFNVRHELVHYALAARGIVSPDVDTEEHVADAFASGNPGPLAELVAAATPAGVLGIRTTCPRLAVLARNEP